MKSGNTYVFMFSKPALIVTTAIVGGSIIFLIERNRELKHRIKELEDILDKTKGD